MAKKFEIQKQTFPGSVAVAYNDLLGIKSESQIVLLPLSQHDLPLISTTVTFLTEKLISALTALKKYCRADFTRLIHFSTVRIHRIILKH